MTILNFSQRSLLVAAALFVCACRGDDADVGFSVWSAHEAYAAGLHHVGLDTTALGREWIDAASHSLASPTPVNVPLREALFLDPARANALGYRLSLQRGQRLVASVKTAKSPHDDLRVFMDLFAADRAGDLRPVTDANPTHRVLRYVVPRSGSYLLRVQPELLRGGRLTVAVAAEMAFPVAGRDTTAIGSVFGDPRDGGSRAHEGVDIFAPRGTPALATVSGRVGRVGREYLGGNVVWLREPHGRLFYYAHLERAAVHTGQVVRPGDTVGFVGNTGNAIHSPPHLHFGVYLPGAGAVDPERILSGEGARAVRLAGDVNLLGTWARVRRSVASLRTAPNDTAAEIARLPRGTPVQVQAATGQWYLARLAGVGGGYVALGELGPLGSGQRRTIASSARLLTAPVAGGIVMDSLPAGTAVRVLGRYEDYYLVQRADSSSGWIARAGFTRAASPQPAARALADLSLLAASLSSRVRLPRSSFEEPAPARKPRLFAFPGGIVP